MIIKRMLTILGLIAIIEGFFQLLHPPQLIDNLAQAPELIRKAMDLTFINMGLVIGGGLMILMALFIKK